MRLALVGFAGQKVWRTTRERHSLLAWIREHCERFDMRTRTAAIVIAVFGFAMNACGGDAPTGPAGSAMPTELHVETNAPVSESDPTGLVVVSVFQGEVGGTISIEVCADDAGLPLPGDYRIDSDECAESSGRWIIATDDQGRLWDRQPIDEFVLLRFEREPGQAALLFRTSYQAPNTGNSKSVDICPWTLAEHSDVGVLCTSDNEFRLLPRVLAGEGATVAF